MDSYAAAKQDFAARAGLIPRSALFDQEQLAEIYLCVDLEMDGSTRIRDERQEVLRGIMEQIKELVPDVVERAEQSFLKDPDMDDTPKPNQIIEM